MFVFGCILFFRASITSINKKISFLFSFIFLKSQLCFLLYIGRIQNFDISRYPNTRLYNKRDTFDHSMCQVLLSFYTSSLQVRLLLRNTRSSHSHRLSHKERTSRFHYMNLLLLSSLRSSMCNSISPPLLVSINLPNLNNKTIKYYKKYNK